MKDNEKTTITESEFVDFVINNGRLPNDTEAERLLYLFYKNVKYNAQYKLPTAWKLIQQLELVAKKPPCSKRQLRVCAPKNPTLEKQFLIFIGRNGRLPVETEEELPLYCFYIYVRLMASQKYPLVSKIIKRLEQDGTPITEKIKNETQTRKIREIFWNFVKKAGELPRSNTKGQHKAYQALFTIKNDKDRFPDEWKFVVESTRPRRYYEFIDFVKKNGRMPKRIEGELPLLVFYYKVKKKCPEKYPEILELAREMKLKERFPEAWERLYGEEESK